MPLLTGHMFNTLADVKKIHGFVHSGRERLGSNISVGWTRCLTPVSMSMMMTIILMLITRRNDIRWTTYYACVRSLESVK